MNDIATRAREAAFHCEARKIALRQSKEGLTVTLLIHPQEMPPELSLAALGTRYTVAFVELADDETPAAPAPVAAPETPREAKPRNPDAIVAAKSRYAALSDMEKACADAGRLAKDPKFAEWVKVIARPNDPIDPVEYIRLRCNVESRREIATDRRAYTAFIALETDFQIATGQMATPR